MICSECKKNNIKADVLYRRAGQRARGYVCDSCRKKAEYEKVLSYTERKQNERIKKRSNRIFA